MIIPAVMEKKLDDIRKKVGTVDGRCEFIQIDIADGKLVSESSFANIEMIAGIEPISKLEIHLMTDDPEIYVKESYPSIFKISAHVEAKGVENFIRKAVENKYIVGLSVKPETTFENLDDLPGGISFVQFLTVRPGKQGNELMPEVFPKIMAFKQKYPGVKVQVDGGINEENIQEVLKLGVDDVVIGSRIVNSENPAEMLAKFKELAAQ
jgi:ribulose-phosphate 3-epimerase